MRNDDTTPNYETMVLQAPATVTEYVREIRASMGDAWCDKNPEAFATLVHAAAIDMLGAMIGKELGKLSNSVDRISQHLDAITD